MLKYENKKTGSLLIIPENQILSSIEDDMYLIKMMIYNDERIIKNKIKNLVTVLKGVQDVNYRRNRKTE